MCVPSYFRHRRHYPAVSFQSPPMNLLPAVYYVRRCCWHPRNWRLRSVRRPTAGDRLSERRLLSKICFQQWASHIEEVILPFSRNCFRLSASWNTAQHRYFDISSDDADNKFCDTAHHQGKVQSADWRHSTVYIYSRVMFDTRPQWSNPYRPIRRLSRNRSSLIAVLHIRELICVLPMTKAINYVKN